ncbi:MAG: bacillithiol biosynthesis deacetylase BshB1 [Saprospiraceae bacterium]|nr:bacillithiol biosynthesis deacetylase BshB1 [Saprospiraceae bacterium]
MGEKKVDILAIGVHPDDVELGCGATLIKHIDMGYSAAIVDLTRGELGTRGNPELRLQESEAARAYAGVKYRENLELRDGFFENNEDAKLKIIRAIRKYRPEILFANAVRDRHPDHGNAAKLVYEASFLAGLSKIETIVDGQAQQKWRPKKLLNYIQDFNLEPDVVVDISDYMERKIEMVLCFESQFYSPDSSEEETPISSSDFLEFLRARARSHGRHIGASFGEGFTCESYIGIDNIFSLK